MHAVAHALDYDLDEHGVSVIDAQNNGRPDTFAALARALGIPWLAVFDGDAAGRSYVQAIAERGFDQAELAARCRTHPAGDLEAQLVADGCGPELREIMTALGVRGAGGVNDEVLETRLRNNKTAYAAAFAERLRAESRLAQRAPEAFRAAIGQLRGLA